MLQTTAPWCFFRVRLAFNKMKEKNAEETDQKQDVVVLGGAVEWAGVPEWWTLLLWGSGCPQYLAMHPCPGDWHSLALPQCLFLGHGQSERERLK